MRPAVVGVLHGSQVSRPVLISTPGSVQLNPRHRGGPAMNVTFRRRIMPPTNPNHARGSPSLKLPYEGKAGCAPASSERELRVTRKACGSWTDRSNGPKHSADRAGSPCRSCQAAFLIAKCFAFFHCSCCTAMLACGRMLCCCYLPSRCARWEWIRRSIRATVEQPA
jgi:hypothetical protein